MQSEVQLFTAKRGGWYPYKPSKLGILIRWGTTTKAPQAEVVYNTAQAIRITTDKARCRQELFNHGIPVPVQTEFVPCVGRTKRHTRGQGFWMCNTIEDVMRAKREGAYYFSGLYPKIQEFRVHVVHGRVLLVSEKVGTPQGVIWNHENGFKFVTVRWSLWREDIIKTAMRAIEVLGLDFGAVDMLIGEAGHVVCEVNTAPSLGDYASSKYAQYFDWLGGSDVGREHLDNTDYVFRGEDY